MTIPELQALNLGYLSGKDIARYCSPQLLIKQWNVDNTVLTEGVTTGVSEVQQAAQNRYDLSGEFAKAYNAGNRDVVVVKLSAIAAVRNILGDAQSVGDNMAAWFMWLDSSLKALRNGQFPLKQPGVAPVTVTDPITQLPVTYVPDSKAEIVRSSFLTLG